MVLKAELKSTIKIQFNLIQVYLYSAFYDTIVAKRFTGNYVSTIYLYIVET